MPAVAPLWPQPDILWGRNWIDSRFTFEMCLCGIAELLGTPASCFCCSNSSYTQKALSKAEAVRWPQGSLLEQRHGSHWCVSRGPFLLLVQWFPSSCTSRSYLVSYVFQRATAATIDCLFKAGYICRECFPMLSRCGNYRYGRSVT